MPHLPKHEIRARVLAVKEELHALETNAKWLNDTATLPRIAELQRRAEDLLRATA